MREVIIHPSGLIDYGSLINFTLGIINQRKTKMDGYKVEIKIETKRKNRIINLVRFFCVYKRGIQ